MLELKNICYEQNGKKILNNINLCFDCGITAFTGPNGAGKSTLTKIIMGIINPTSGKIIFNNQDITNLSITERANLGISYSFQQPVKFKGLKVKDILRIASKEKNVSTTSYLSSVGLCAKEYQSRDLNSELSGGELKRIEIASVLARNSNVTIFDEPEAGIDLWSFDKLVNTFKKFQEKNKGITIIISHQEKMLKLADKIVLLENGKIKKTDTFDKICQITSLNIKSCKGCRE